jgi:uncharacterized membrane protein
MVTPNDIINFLYDFIVYNPFIAMGIAAVLGIIIYIRPKEVLKFLGIILLIAAVIYVLFYIFGASETGVLQKDTLIHKSL